MWEDADPDKERVSRTLLQDVRGQSNGPHDTKIKIPKLVLGELVSNYYRDLENGDISTGYQPPADEFLKNIRSWINQLNADLVSMKTDTWQIARKLHKQDRMLAHNDLFIASLAVWDDCSTHLLTYDGGLTESRSITEVARSREGRKHSLTVSSEYH